MKVPSSNSSNSSPVSKEPSEPSRPRQDTQRKDKQPQREFKLPDERKEDEEKLKEIERLKAKEKKKEKKGLFDVAYPQTIKELKQEVSTSAEAGITGSEKITGASASEAMSKITKLLQKMVSEMQIGTVGGQHYMALTLSKNVDVPQAFQDAHLSINFQENGLVIQFDRFSTPQSEQNAIFIVEQNKEQLTQLIHSLSAKNIQISQLNIGAHPVALPKVEGLPPPFQPTTAERGEGELREGKGDEGGQPSEEEGNE